MPVLRIEHNTDFTVIPNGIFRDKSLSLRDVGLLCYMLSLPNEWKFSLKGMEAILPLDGRDSIRAGLSRLESVGYLYRKRQRDAQNGKLGSVTWIISDVPKFQGNSPHSEIPNMEPPRSGLPNVDLPTVENPPQVNKKEVTTQEDTMANKLAKSLTDFDLFWKAYPRKVGKQAALKAFKKIKGVPVETMIQAIETQRRFDAWQRDNGQYIPHPATWLNQGRWDDEPFDPSQIVEHPEGLPQDG